MRGLRMTGCSTVESGVGAIPGKGCGGLAFDEDGFLIDPSLWTEQMGRIIAEIRGIGPLHSDHWMILHYLRDRYLRLGAIPPLRRICRNSTLSRKDIKTLFRNCLEVWRIAGLPNPGEEAKAYMG